MTPYLPNGEAGPHCNNHGCKDSDICKRYMSPEQENTNLLLFGNVYYVIHAEPPTDKDGCQFYDPSIEFAAVELTPKRYTVKK